MASFIETFFYDYDHAILSFFHGMALFFGDFLTPLSFLLKRIGELPTLLTLWFAFYLLLFTKKKKTGLSMLLAMGIGIVINSFILKTITQRLRPYEDPAFYECWKLVGASTEKTTSFPSGHSCSAFSSITALFLSCKDKKKASFLFLYPFLMSCSRIYLFVHYPSDVLFGSLIGILSGISVHFLLKKYGYRLPEKFLKEE